LYFLRIIWIKDKKFKNLQNKNYNTNKPKKEPKPTKKLSNIKIKEFLNF